MITEPMTPLHASLAALSASRLDSLGDRYTFQLDPAKSHVQYDVESCLGPCTLGPCSQGNLEGSLDLVLHPGVFPVSSGQESGGPCACRPDLVGVVPSSAPGQPPFLRIGLASLAITPHSQPFELDARGQFQAAFDCEISEGTISVSLFGGLPVCVPLAGSTPEDGHGHGEVWIDAVGIHLRREIAVAFYLDEPALGLDLCLRIHGMLRGDMALPVPPRSSSSNEHLLVTRGAPGTIGLCLLGGTSCVAGDPLRLCLIGVDGRGPAVQALDVKVPAVAGHLVPAASWSFQFGYRDSAAGRAGFHASEAAAVDLVP